MTNKQTFPMTNGYGTFKTKEEWDKFSESLINYYQKKKYTGD